MVDRGGLKIQVLFSAALGLRTFKVTSTIIQDMQNLCKESPVLEMKVLLGRIQLGRPHPFSARKLRLS